MLNLRDVLRLCYRIQKDVKPLEKSDDLLHRNYKKPYFTVL